MPYLRSFGSLLISVALAFLLVFPFMLSVFYLMGDVLVDRSNNYIPDVGGTALTNFLNEGVFPEKEAASAASSLTGATFGVELARDMYFSNGANPGGAIMFAAYAFVAAVFMPTAALLATIASISYIARLYGEEIDLSRLTQMV